MKEDTMSVDSAKSDSNELEIASIFSIRFIILCFLVTLANDSHCGFAIGTLHGIIVGSLIGTIYASALESDGSRRRAPRKPPDKNVRIRSRMSVG